MRTLFITAALAAVIPGGTAMAQGGTTTVTTTTVTTPPRRPAPSATSSSEPSANVFVPDGVEPSGPVPGTGGDGVIHEWAPQQPVMQAVPDAAASYPLCTHGRTDSCRNPDPAKELPYYRPKD